MGEKEIGISKRIQTVINKEVLSLENESGLLKKASMEAIRIEVDKKAEDAVEKICTDEYVGVDGANVDDDQWRVCDILGDAMKKVRSELALVTKTVLLVQSSLSVSMIDSCVRQV